MDRRKRHNMTDAYVSSIRGRPNSLPLCDFYHCLSVPRRAYSRLLAASNSETLLAHMDGHQGLTRESHRDGSVLPICN